MRSVTGCISGDRLHFKCVTPCEGVMFDTIVFGFFRGEGDSCDRDIQRHQVRGVCDKYQHRAVKTRDCISLLVGCWDVAVFVPLDVPEVVSATLASV